MKYRILHDPLGHDVGKVLTATDQMMEEFKEDIPRWIENGMIEWVIPGRASGPRSSIGRR